MSDSNLRLRMAHRTPEPTSGATPTKRIDWGLGADNERPEDGPFACGNCDTEWRFDENLGVLEVLECPTCAGEMTVRCTSPPEGDDDE